MAAQPDMSPEQAMEVEDPNDETSSSSSSGEEQAMVDKQAPAAPEPMDEDDPPAPAVVEPMDQDDPPAPAAEELPAVEPVEVKDDPMDEDAVVPEEKKEEEGAPPLEEEDPMEDSDDAASTSESEFDFPTMEEMWERLDNPVPDLGSVPYTEYDAVVKAAQAYPYNAAKAQLIIDDVSTEERKYHKWRVEYATGGAFFLRVHCDGEPGPLHNMFGNYGDFKVHEDQKTNDDVIEFSEELTWHQMLRKLEDIDFWSDMASSTVQIRCIPIQNEIGRFCLWDKDAIDQPCHATKNYKLAAYSMLVKPCRSVMYPGVSEEDAMEAVGTPQFPTVFLNERVGLTQEVVQILNKAGLGKEVKAPTANKPFWSVTEEAAKYLLVERWSVIEALELYGDEVLKKAARGEDLTTQDLEFYDQRVLRFIYRAAQHGWPIVYVTYNNVRYKASAGMREANGALKDKFAPCALNEALIMNNAIFGFLGSRFHSQAKVAQGQTTDMVFCSGS